MSGYTEEGIVHPGMLNSSTAFLEKPFTAHELIGRIRDLLASDGTVPS